MALKVKKFFGCYDLEQGGKIIAWWNILSGLLGLICAIALGSIFMFYGCEILRQEDLAKHNSNQEVLLNTTTTAASVLDSNATATTEIFVEVTSPTTPPYVPTNEELCDENKTVLIVLLIISAICEILTLVFALMFFRGLKNRNTGPIKFMVFLYVMCILYDVLEIATLKTELVIHGVIKGIFHVYIIVVLYSIYDWFKSGSSAQSGAKPYA